ncbi:MAG: hypothetical protein ACT4QE_10270 [Anaerolineales bacterium]
MLNKTWQRRLLIVLAMFAGLLASALALAATFGMLSLYQAADHPDAVLVSDHSQYRWAPALHFRRDTSYQAGNEFPQLYNWYSQRFALGPEASAESACITMEKADKVLLVERVTTVKLCDTGEQRRIYVTRTFTLRYR